MKRTTFLVLGFVVGQIAVSGTLAEAEQHRATRLGNPATRFAPPLVTPDDLRARFRDEQLKPDIASVLRQWGWKGNLDDLHRAALTNEISEVEIPVGNTMPFMSSREHGKAVCLRNVLWAGKEPITAFAFDFSSNGRRYRCVTPKPCSNFFLEDLGSDARPGLAVECSAPAQALSGRPVKVCLTIRNTGNVPESKTIVTLPIPEGARLDGVTDDGVAADGSVAWEISNLAPNGNKQICAVVSARELGSLSWNATASSVNVGPIQTACETKIVGVPAILLEVADIEDPVDVGKQVTYEIKVTNQGSADGTHIRLVCKLPASQEFITGSGVTLVQAEAGTVTMETLSSLVPKAVASWRVVVKALKIDDARFRVELSSDQFERPITQVESTHLY